MAEALVLATTNGESANAESLRELKCQCKQDESAGTALLVVCKALDEHAEALALLTSEIIFSVMRVFPIVTTGTSIFFQDIENFPT